MKKCKCVCHEKGTNVRHIMPCCNYSGIKYHDAYEVGVTTDDGTKTIDTFNTLPEAKNQAKEYRKNNPNTDRIWVDRWITDNGNGILYDIDDTFEEIHF